MRRRPAKLEHRRADTHKAPDHEPGDIASQAMSNPSLLSRGHSAAERNGLGDLFCPHRHHDLRIAFDHTPNVFHLQALIRAVEA